MFVNINMWDRATRPDVTSAASGFAKTLGSFDFFFGFMLALLLLTCHAHYEDGAGGIAVGGRQPVTGQQGAGGDPCSEEHLSTLLGGGNPERQRARH